MAWRAKYPDSMIKGYKVNLQHALGTKLPNGILNLFFKFAVGRKVSKNGNYISWGEAVKMINLP